MTNLLLMNKFKSIVRFIRARLSPALNSKANGCNNASLACDLWILKHVNIYTVIDKSG